MGGYDPDWSRVQKTAALSVYCDGSMNDWARRAKTVLRAWVDLGIRLYNKLKFFKVVLLSSRSILGHMILLLSF